MKIFIAVLICATLFACSTFQKNGYLSKTWDEVGHTPFSDIKSGIPVYDGAIVSYKRAGKDVLKVKLAEPVVVGMATKEEKWGFFQFPNIYRGLDKKVVTTWNMSDDAITSYGTGSRSFSISNDSGKTWSPARQEPVIGGGLLLPDGDRIEIYTPKALKVEDLQLPKPVGSSLTHPDPNSKRYTYLYKVSELPEDLQGVYINRLQKGETKWTTEHAVLDDSQAVRYSRAGLFPVVWWGDMKIVADSSILAGVYPGFYLREDGIVDPSGVSFYRSVDKGHTWKIHSRIPYMPDLKADPNGDKRLIRGFGEPAFEILSDGSFLCVMRTSDGLGISPMYFSRSVDMGLTWSKPKPFTRNGVMPRLLQLENGVIVLVSGRPGVQLRLCTDGKGEKWTDPFEMLPYENETEAVSCGYTELLVTGEDSFLMIYSDFRYPNQAGEIRKAIKVREVKVSMTEVLHKAK